MLGLLSNKKAISSKGTPVAEFSVINGLVSKYIQESSVEQIKLIINKYYQIGSLYAEYLINEG